MRYRLILILALGLWLGVGCAIDQGPSRFESPAYRQAPGWVQEKIDKGRISEGMTIEQCRLSWSGSGSYFYQVKKDSKGYELWRVENGDRRLYLHVQDGIVTLITEYKR